MLFWSMFASSLSLVEGAHWAVLAATSQGYTNYRHQAGVCHAYQTLKDNGFEESKIIVMAFDDVAFGEFNPFPGKLFHKPDPEGAGRDVYAGCQIDYRGADVTPEVFMGILDGSGPGRVLQSESGDNVFIYVVDHGSVGFLAFPNKMELHKEDLQATLQTMYSKGMFNKLVVYLEACEGGSMFQGVDVPGVYAVSSTDAEKSSLAWYCSPPAHQGDAATVAGVDLNTCLADLWSAAWLEDSDGRDIQIETLSEQYEATKSRVSQDGDHFMKMGVMGLPQQWGALGFAGDAVGGFQGGERARRAAPGRRGREAAGAGLPVPEVALALARHRYRTAAPGAERVEAGAAFLAVLEDQLEAEAAYSRFLEVLYPGDAEKQAAIAAGKSPADQKECELSAHAAFKAYGKFDATTSFALRFHKYVVNACADVAASGANTDVAAAARQACSSPSIV